MIRIDGLYFAIGNFSLRNVTLDIRPGEYFVLLGKPGSGKTLLLECLAGLRRLAGGTITFDGRRVEHLEPAERGVGYVPQDYALFARKTVRENVEFGLRVRGFPRAQREARLSELADLLGLRSLLDRSTAGLSGGERQRVALARALATRPQVLLLDEPVSALDDETRDGILAELRRIQRETGTTTLHVCHDLDEMRLVADRVGILRDGRLVQTGTSEEIRGQPADPGVARLFRLGTILKGVVVADEKGRRLDLGSFSVLVPFPPTADGTPLRSVPDYKPAEVEGPVEVLIRAAAVQVEVERERGERRAFGTRKREDTRSREGTSSGTLGTSEGGGERAGVRSVCWGDATVRLELEVGSTCLRAEIPRAQAEEGWFGGPPLQPDCELRVVIPPEAVYVFT
jgi:ABC-type Fe3+/spermidine/putrescine transport system ATPase subunit